ncbi:MAG TPA: MFS transporter, partial [Acidimicrobiales bacterium]|nr:MFS transporter [Acidimicrobiales bacterium]
VDDRMDERTAAPAPGARLGLHGWLDPPVLGIALVMAAAGFAQFSPAAALADVAEHFGRLRDGDTVAEQAGLPGTVLGTGLAAIRLSALAALPLAGLADRWGRRRSMLTWATLGLLAVVTAAASPGYWWFVALFALARPLLTATDTVGEVMAAEHTSVHDRARAIALMSAAYGLGAGAVAVLRAVLGSGLGFRAVFALSLLPLGLVAVAARRVTEPARFGAATAVRPAPVLGAVQSGRRGRLAALAGLAFASGLVTGPANTLLFVYAENVLDVSTAVTGALVVAAAPAGLAGLVAGRYLSDRVGRRPTAAVALVALCGAGVVTYLGPVPALVAGYLIGVLVGAAYATPAIALAAELFPTSARASVAGWLVVAGVLGASSGLLLAGAVADATGSFGAAMAWVCIPAALAAVLLAAVPETRGRELEETAPEAG